MFGLLLFLLMHVPVRVKVQPPLPPHVYTCDASYNCQRVR